jgi:hypothetical protein
MVFRVVDFIPFAGFDEVSGKFRPPLSLLPYGLLLAESSQLAKQALIPIHRRSDFLKFWRVYKERGLDYDEEIVVSCPPRAGILRRFRDVFEVHIDAEGAYDHMFRGGPQTEAMQKKNEESTVKFNTWTSTVFIFGTEEQKRRVEGMIAAFKGMAERVSRSGDSG